MDAENRENLIVSLYVAIVSTKTYVGERQGDQAKAAIRLADELIEELAPTHRGTWRLDPGMKESHRQTLVRVRAPVDEGIASLVEAINELPGVYTTQSCEGPEDGSAFVWFRRNETAAESGAFLAWLAPHVERVRGVRLSGEWGGGERLRFDLRVERPAIAELEAEVRKLTGRAA